MGSGDRPALEALLPADAPDGQRRAVGADERLVAVGAGAGTGKTWVLANRYARLLLEDPSLLPRDILTLTFTEAAADEMRQRIEARVRELVVMPSPPFDAARGRALMDGLGEAWVSTIHSSAKRLIREGGLALDIDPMSTLISDPQEAGFWESVREGIEHAAMADLARPWGDERIVSAAAALDEDPILGAAVGRWGADALAHLAKETTELHASMGRSWEQMICWADIASTGDDPLVESARAAVEPIVRAELRRMWDTWAEVFGALRDMISMKGEEDRRKGKQGSATVLLAELMDRWSAAMSAGEPDDGELRAFCLDVMDRGMKPHGYEPFKSVKAMLGMTLGDWRKAQSGHVVALAAVPPGAPLPEPERALRSTLLRLCATSWGLWDAMKRRRGLLTFSDMILHARAALGAGAVERTFRHVLVDEFQDTDRLQFDMIEALVASDRAGKAGSLFAVGDIKQSIYRFRHAEPELFAQTIGRADANVELDVSFRARASLLERIDGLFSHIWRDGLGTSDAMAKMKFEPLSPAPLGPERDAGTIPPFSVLLATKDDEKIAAVRERLARALARRIAAWVEEGRTVWDKQGRALRPVRYRDFAVLARTRTSHGLLEDVLASEGVPAVQDRSRSWMSRGEVGDVVCLLRVAASADDEAALAGWLLSPFSGVSMEDALRCLERAPSLPLADAIAELLPDASARLERLRRVGSHEGPSALLALLDRDRRWAERYAPRDRLRAVRNVRHALSLARTFQRGDEASLSACADWLDRSMRGGVAMEEPTWRSPGDDAVLLSTIHAAKGLEWPVTVLFDTSDRKERGGKGSALRPSAPLGLASSSLLDEGLSDKGATPISSMWHALLSEQGELEEDMRLFYVAATRAQDSLVHCGLAEQDDGALVPMESTWTELLIGHMKERGDCGEDLMGPDVSLVAPEDASHPLRTSTRSGAVLPAPRMIVLPPHDGPTLAELSATSFALFEWCPFAWRRRYRQGLDLRWESPDRGALAEMGREAPSAGGAELGSLAHWIMARWPSLDGDEEAELDRLLGDRSTLLRLPSYLRDTWRDEEAKAALRGWLSHFASSPTGEEVRRALRMGARREARFDVPLEGLRLVGSMDIVWRGPSDDGEDRILWRVLDYKITTAQDAPPGLYEAQLGFYALALREMARAAEEACDEMEVGLVFLREGGRMERRRAGDEDELKAKIFDAARRGAVGDCPPRHEHCPACPWRGGCPAAKAT